MTYLCSMKKVLVTGVSGFIAQHCAAQLLHKGYAVKGSVRSTNKQDEIISGFKNSNIPIENLEFCTLDLLSDDGWKEAMEECDYVFHIASPYFIKVPKNENDMLRPAIEGTIRALSFAQKAGIKRVVLTSSIVAMIGEDSQKNKTLNPNNWTDLDWNEITPYIKSKTKSEKEAWKFIANQKGQHKIELTTIHPGAVYGPTITNNLNGESMSMITKLIQGKIPFLPKTAIAVSDVRDIAATHILAIEKVEANNKRLIVTTDKAYSIIELAKILKKEGFKKVSTIAAPNWLLYFLANFDSEVKGVIPFVGKSISTDISLTKEVLNWEPIDVRKTILDTAYSAKKALESKKD